jgi:hypothetical protein
MPLNPGACSPFMELDTSSSSDSGIKTLPSDTSMTIISLRNDISLQGPDRVLPCIASSSLRMIRSYFEA